MILQLGSLFSGLITGVGQFGANVFGQAAQALVPLAQAGIAASLDIGTQYVGGLINRELTRSARNDQEAAVKSALRAAANAVAPTVAPGQTAVYSGGPATGSAFMPATLIAPSLEPPQRVLRTDPDHFSQSQTLAFQAERRPPDLFVGGGLAPPGGIGTSDVVLPGLAFRALQAAGTAIGRFGGTARGLPRAMAGLTATAIAAETAGAVALDFAFPKTAGAPGAQITGSFPTEGDPLRITGANVPTATGIPTGLPRTGQFQREANGVRVQWFFFNGQQMQPIAREQADCVKRECIFRLNVFTGKFIKLKGRRMNPMNVKAFFRAGRRVDSGERICRKMFSEHRKTKTGTVRRKRAKKKK